MRLTKKIKTTRAFPVATKRTIEGIMTKLVVAKALIDLSELVAQTKETK